MPTKTKPTKTVTADVEGDDQELDVQFSGTASHESALNKLVPGFADADDSEKMSRLVEYLTESAKADDVDAGVATDSGDEDLPGLNMSMKREDVREMAMTRRAKGKEALSKVKTLEKQIKSMSNRQDAAEAIKAPEDPDMVRETIQEKKQRCLDAGALTPAVAEALEMSLIGDEDEPRWLGMARVENENGRKLPLAAVVFDILAANKGTVVAGRRTNAQHGLIGEGRQAMSRKVPGEDEAASSGTSPGEAERAANNFREKLGTAHNADFKL